MRVCAISMHLHPPDCSIRRVEAHLIRTTSKRTLP